MRPAIRKARKFERENGDRKGVGRSRGRFKLPTKEQYATVGEKLGIPREVSEKEYDKFLESRGNGNHH